MRQTTAFRETAVFRWEIALTEFWGFMFVLVRTAAILAAIPLLGSRTVPVRVKIALAFAMALVLMPVVSVSLSPEGLQPWNVVIGLMRELIVGMVLGLATRLLMGAVELAGSVMGFQVGFGVIGMLDPVSQVETPVFGQLLTVLATLLYFQVDGHHLVLLALAASFQLIPPFAAHLGPPVLADVVQYLQDMLVTAVRIALPVMAVTFLVHLTLGILGRLVPQMNILLTSFPLTISAGLLVLGLGLPMIAIVFQDAVFGIERMLWTLLKDLGHG
ncbi:MAG: flagellar biosynthetic protein FliR [Nitrospirae bacterium]|nr:MAG: flagellar biosynthetic protein FliR [Nitrospirota bacterium]